MSESTTASPWLELKSAESNVYSQAGEDGVIDQIFKLIGTTNKIAVDIGAGDGFNLSNTQRLREQNWRVYMYDKAPGGLPAGKFPVNYSKGYPGLKPEDKDKVEPGPQINHVLQATITHLNVNHINPIYNLPKPIDMLSIDIDGQDYWVWKHLKLTARVVVIEFNPSYPPEDSVTVAPQPNFTWTNDEHYGASFAAMKSLGESKGYVLVHNTSNLNLFFVLKSALPPDFVAPDVAYSVKHDHAGATDVKRMTVAAFNDLHAKGNSPIFVASKDPNKPSSIAKVLVEV